MTDSNKEETKHVITQAEYEALLKAPTELTMSTYQEALSTKTLQFKVYFFAISGIAATYLLVYFLGGLDKHLAFGWSSAPEDDQLHKLRFLLGFVMLVLLHALLLLRQRLYTASLSSGALITYFVVSGTSRLLEVGAATKNLPFLLIYFGIHLALIVLAVLIAFEDERSFKREWSP